MTELSDSQCKAILDAVVTSFYARHPELQRAIMTDVVLYGAMTAKTHEAVMQAFEADANEELPYKNGGLNGY